MSDRQYTAHVRLHFVTNLGVAGGLILLQNFGAGRWDPMKVFLLHSGLGSRIRGLECSD